MIYKFFCANCNQEIEVNIHHTKISEVKECPICKHSPITRVYSMNYVCKCNGFYGKKS
jgi:predicted nucleic acid-binding Zn ribbon protein